MPAIWFMRVSPRRDRRDDASAGNIPPAAEPHRHDRFSLKETAIDGVKRSVGD
jgi:hypothetical protein